MAVAYFASDFHLGIDTDVTAAARERKVVDWLEYCRKDADAIYFIGDVFDFWFEYKKVVPKGYVRFLGKLAQLADQGIALYFFAGNHDMWMKDYFEKEFKATFIRDEFVLNMDGQTFFLSHGDGKGPGDGAYKLLKKVFASPVSKWCFARLHPNFGIGLAEYLSARSRSGQLNQDVQFFESDEWLIQYAERKLAQRPDIDFFLFGHRHIPSDWKLSNGHSRCLNLGDWLNYDSYAKWNGTELILTAWQNDAFTYYTNFDAQA